MTKHQLEQLQNSKEQSERQSEDQARSHDLRSGHKEMAYEQIAWRDAVKDFLRQSLSTKEQKTQKYYQLNLERLAAWATGENIALPDFRVRHMREYIAVRSEGTQGRGEGGRVCERTLRHDAICICVFIRYCAAEGYIPRDPLTDYVIPKAPKAFVKCPSDQEVSTLL